MRCRNCACHDRACVPNNRVRNIMKSSNKRKIYHTNGITAMRIEGEMNIYRAGELKKLLHPTLSHKGVLEVDLSVVTELDTAGLQLLVLAKKSAQARDGSLRLTARSPMLST